MHQFTHHLRKALADGFKALEPSGETVEMINRPPADRPNQLV